MSADIYARFDYLVTKNGCKIAEISKETGIKPNVFSNWKKRGGCLSADNMSKISSYFGVPIGYFLEEDFK